MLVFALQAAAETGGKVEQIARTFGDTLGYEVAERLGETLRRGRIAPGLDGDLVVLGADPSADVTAFANVRYTIRGGEVVYKAPSRVEGRRGLAR